MAYEMRQHHKLLQKMVMTQQLQQAIKLLQLSRIELLERVQLELENNPVLEEGLKAEGDISLDASHGNGRVEVDWQDYLEGYHEAPLGPRFRREEDELPLGATLSRETTLMEHLLWQLQLSSFTPEEVGIGVSIIGNLDEDGYLRVTTQELSQWLGVGEDVCEGVLRKIQGFDPPGVAARDLKECLLIQVRSFPCRFPLVEEIIDHYLGYLEKGDYKGIADALSIHPMEVTKVVEIITSLDPRPGRAWSSVDVHTIIPDIYIQKVGDEYVVLLNEDGLPRLRISPYYRKILSTDEAVPSPAKAYIQERFRSAVWLIRSIHQRQRTIYKVAHSIIKFQREFLDKGMDYLRPLVLKDVSEDIGVHESTVSRCTSNKYAHTPQGILELRSFFNAGMWKDDGTGIAVKSVVDKVKAIIASEDRKKPLSDQDIVELLKGGGINTARRTITKYRKIMGIPPSSRRKRLF